MYKNQLQELAQRSCFNLPSYTCVREGPDHAPRFKAVVNFNGENFESPQYCSTLRQAEHSAAEAALASLSSRGVSQSLAARVLDETGVYKNLLQEIAQRVGSPLPFYTTFRSGLSHLPVFTGTVELAGITFRGEPAKNKKQAEKNAALAAWLALKKLAKQDAGSANENVNSDEQEQIRIARALQNLRLMGKLELITSSTLTNPMATSSVQPKFSASGPRPLSPQRPAMSTSKMLPLFYQRAPPQNRTSASNYRSSSESCVASTSRFGVGAAPYTPIKHCYQGIAPPVTIRTSIPVYSAPPRPAAPQSPSSRPASPQVMQCHAPAKAISIRSVVPVFAAPPSRRDDRPSTPASLPLPLNLDMPASPVPQPTLEVRASSLPLPSTLDMPASSLPLPSDLDVPVSSLPLPSNLDVPASSLTLPPSLDEPDNDSSDVNTVVRCLEQLDM